MLHLPANSSPICVLPFRHPTRAMNTAARWSASPSHRAPPRRIATPPHATPAMSGCLAPRNPRSPDSAPDVKPTPDSILSARAVRPVSTCDLGGSTMPGPAENFWAGRHPAEAKSDGSADLVTAFDPLSRPSLESTAARLNPNNRARVLDNAAPAPPKVKARSTIQAASRREPPLAQRLATKAT